jgi:phage terminase large subunit-like protein
MNPKYPHDYKLSELTSDWVVTKSDEVAVREGCYFDIKAATRVLDFFCKFVKHIDGGESAGKPFYPLPWQWERVIAPAFGWKLPSGYRRFREIEVWIPKKNGKTTLMAGLVLYVLIADREVGAHVYSAGSDRRQAGLMYKSVQSMIKRSPALASLVRVKDSIKHIDCPLMDSFYEVISADAFRNEGLNIHGLFFDELHTQKNRQLWGALRYGAAARKQGIRFVLSTAGLLDEQALWWERFNAALAVQEGRKIDIHLLACVYAMKPSDDWNDPEVWKRVNPSWDGTIDHIEFKRDYENSKQNGASESEFKRYRLNMPTRALATWLPYRFWDMCNEKVIANPVNFRGKRIFIGVDLADSIDLCAAVGIWEEEENGHSIICAKAMFWAPSEAGNTANQHNRDRYEKFWEEKHMKLVPDAVVMPDGLMEKETLEEFQESEIVKVGIDMYNATRFRKVIEGLIEDYGLDTEVEMVRYNGTHMNEPTRFLAALIVSGRLRLEPSPVMDWMFGNLRANTDSSGNVKLDKRNSSNKIDGFAALTIALSCFISCEPEFRSRYENQGLSTMEFQL